VLPDSYRVVSAVPRQTGQRLGVRLALSQVLEFELEHPQLLPQFQVPPGGTWLTLAHQIQDGKPVRFLEDGDPIPWLPTLIPAAPRQATATPTLEDAAQLLEQAETEDGVDGEELVCLLEGKGRVPEALQKQLEMIRGGDATAELMLEVLLAIDGAAS